MVPWRLGRDDGGNDVSVRLADRRVVLPHDAAAVAGVAAALFAVFLSNAQRQLSTPARALRRKTDHVDGSIVRSDGTVVDIDQGVLLEPLERALRALTWATVVLAITLMLARLTPWP